MRRRRFKACAKWACTVLAAVVVAAWVVGGWYILRVRWPDGAGSTSLECAVGRISFSRQSPAPGPPGPEIVRLHRWYGWRWLFSKDSVAVPGLTMTDWNAPLWPLFVLLAVPAVTLWTVDRRSARFALLGGCRSCGYDRTGLAADTKCPECGTVPAAR